MFDCLRADRSNGSEEEVAAVFGAATDGTTQLRYLGTEGIRGLVTLRRETNETQYMTTMRQRFLR